MIQVTNEIKIYEIGGRGVEALKLPCLKVQSHWNQNEMVVLVFPGMEPLTIAGCDLIAAITNARNNVRF